MRVSNEQVKKTKLNYKFVSIESEELERRLRQAYSVIFESVLRELNNKNEQ